AYGTTNFHTPACAATDPNGNLYVLDSYLYSVFVFNSAGATVTSWSAVGNLLAVSPVPPYNVYVGSYSQVEEFSPAGTLLTTWGGAAPSPGVGQGKFEKIYGMGVDPNGNVYVSDAENGTNKDDFVQEFSPSGTFLTQWGGTGTGTGQFTYPAQIGFANNDIYV